MMGLFNLGSGHYSQHHNQLPLCVWKSLLSGLSAGMRANNSMSSLRNQRRSSNTSGPSLSTSNSAPKLGSVAGNAPQAVQRVINERVPLVMTTAVVADTRSTRHLSADGSLRLQEEDKVQQLRNVNLVRCTASDIRFFCQQMNLCQLRSGIYRSFLSREKCTKLYLSSF